MRAGASSATSRTYELRTNAHGSRNDQHARRRRDLERVSPVPCRAHRVRRAERREDRELSLPERCGGASLQGRIDEATQVCAGRARRALTRAETGIAAPISGRASGGRGRKNAQGEFPWQEMLIK